MSSKRGLPNGIKMRHDAHYVEELAKAQRTVGRIIAIEKIAPNPDQPRTEIGDLTELSDSIRQNGVLEPLLVKPLGDGTYMIIAGERRWRASNLAGLTEVPCVEFDIDEKTVAEIALIENLQRKDLTVWEEADGLRYLAEKFGYTHEEIAKKIGKSRTTVTESMAVAGLPEAIRAKCHHADLTAKSTLLEVARQFDEAAMHDFLDNFGKRKPNREEVRRAARPERRTKENTKTAAAAADYDAAAGATADPSENAANAAEVFRYRAADGDFDLEIRFTKTVGFDKRDVLKALKEAFDDAKARQ